ncbi:uncharacterized protein LOC134265970, partial [Saccostrea cucullata]|uniref:uncharacterized protein LOC134265970 n=1 Tax=Saccostrea cuccullata TaxID=36930 RepID=UPI002ED1AEBA
MSNLGKNDRPSQFHQPLRTIATSNTIQNLFLREKAKMNSPMSNLALNLSELSTGRGTPRRKLSLSSIETPPTCASANQEQASSSESDSHWWTGREGILLPLFLPVGGIHSYLLTQSVYTCVILQQILLNRFAKTVKPEIPVEAFT